MEAEIKNIECVIYVIDSRAPFACLNPEFDKIIKNKPVIAVLNKIDMSDEEKVKGIIPNIRDYFGEKCAIITQNSTASGALKTILKNIENLCSEKIARNNAKGVNTFIKAMVIGVPNTGKSTLVNNLCGKAKAVTGNRAGVTKMTQWVSIGDNIEICDTPGTLYPNLEDQEVAKKLLFIGSIKDEVVADNVELAQELLSLINQKYPQLLQARFGDDISLEGIAKKRGFIVGGGEYDLDRCANAVIDDFRKCRIGKITLD